MSDDTVSEKLVATTRMTKSTADKTAKKKVVRKAASTRKPRVTRVKKPQAQQQTASVAAGVQSTALIAGPSSSHTVVIQHGRRVWPD